jgi:LPXTG-motif cell wall-anchored protein
MRRLLLLVSVAFVVTLFLAPSAVAQVDEKAKLEAKGKLVEAVKAEKAKAKEMPKTGGQSVSVILPGAAVLLVGSGVLAYKVVRRR